MEEKEKKQVKLCVFDVADTLVDSKTGLTLSPALINDLNALRAKGYILGVATVRSEKMIGPLSPQFSFDFMILLNGGMVKIKNKYVFSAPLPLRVLDEVLDRANMAGVEAKQYNDAGICYTVELTEAAEKFSPPERCCAVAMSNGTVYVSPVGIHKGKALSMVCRYYETELKNAIAFGDAENDRELLEMAGTAVAMGNAPDALCELATLKTSTAAENGVSLALRKLGIL